MKKQARDEAPRGNGMALAWQGWLVGWSVLSNFESFEAAANACFALLCFALLVNVSVVYRRRPPTIGYVVVVVVEVSK